MNVEEMLSLEKFVGFRIIAGNEGSKAQVTGINVMDAPDVHMWVRGGEFLVTTAYIFKDQPEELVNLIKNIQPAGAVALGIKIGRFIDNIPQTVLNFADKHSFPIVSIPYNFAFSEIIDPLLEEIIENKNKRLEFSEKIHNSFTDLAIMEAPRDKIIKSLGTIINCDFSYQDMLSGDVLYYNVAPHHKTENHNLLKKTGIRTIRYKGKLIGKFCFTDTTNKDQIEIEYMDIAIEHASTVLLLDLQKRIYNKQLESKYRDELLQDLLLNNLDSHEELQNRSRIYDWSFPAELTTLIIEIDLLGVGQSQKNLLPHILGDLREKIFEVAKKNLLSYYPMAKYTNFSGSIVFLIQSDNSMHDAQREQFCGICDHLRSSIGKHTTRTITIGISQSHKPLDSHIGYQEAKKAIRLGRMLKGNNTTIHYEDLGAFRLLEMISRDQLLRFRDQYIQPLIKYDSNHKSSYLATLKALSECEWVIRDAAKHLFVHYNTVKLRINKINQILDVDINHFENRLNIALAIKIHDLLSE